MLLFPQIIYTNINTAKLWTNLIICYFSMSRNVSTIEKVLSPPEFEPRYFLSRARNSNHRTVSDLIFKLLYDTMSPLVPNGNFHLSFHSEISFKEPPLVLTTFKSIWNYEKNFWLWFLPLLFVILINHEYSFEAHRRFNFQTLILSNVIVCSK